MYVCGRYIDTQIGVETADLQASAVDHMEHMDRRLQAACLSLNRLVGTAN